MSDFSYQISAILVLTAATVALMIPVVMSPTRRGFSCGKVRKVSKKSSQDALLDKPFSHNILILNSKTGEDELYEIEDFLYSKYKRIKNQDLIGQHISFTHVHDRIVKIHEESDLEMEAKPA